MEDNIRNRILEKFPEATIDIAGEDCNFEVYIVSDLFDGMSTLQRQKAILALFKDDISSGSLHALTIKAKTQKELTEAGGLVQIKM